MAKLFNRKYELIIIPPEGDVRTITDLKLTFSITKTLFGVPNKGQLKLYNPNEATEAALRERFTQVILNAGYGTDLRLIFKGDVKNITQAKTSVDRVITVFAGDGSRGYEQSTFSKTFDSGVDVRSIVTEVVDSIKDVALGEITGIPANRDKPNGLTLDGQSSHLLDELAAEYNSQWSIQDGVVNFIPVNSTLLDTEAVLINPTTGMIGSPRITERGADVTTLLNNQLTPGGRFIIEASGADVQLGDLNFRTNNVRTNATGLYKALSVTLTGDSRGGPWQSELEGERI